MGKREHTGSRTGTGTGGGPAREWVTFEDPGDEGRTWQIDVTFLLSSWECIFGCGCQGIWTAPTPELVHGCCTYGANFSDKADRDHVVKASQRLTADEWQYAKLGKKNGIFKKAGKMDDGSTEWKTRVVKDAWLSKPTAQPISAIDRSVVSTRCFARSIRRAMT